MREGCGSGSDQTTGTGVLAFKFTAGQRLTDFRLLSVYAVRTNASRQHARLCVVRKETLSSFAKRDDFQRDVRQREQQQRPSFWVAGRDDVRINNDCKSVCRRCALRTLKIDHVDFHQLSTRRQTHRHNTTSLFFWVVGMAVVDVSDVLAIGSVRPFRRLVKSLKSRCMGK